LLKFKYITSTWRFRIIGVTMIFVVLLSPWDEHGKGIGTNMQIALPLLAWGCEAINGNSAEYFLRFGVMFATLRASKYGLGDSSINQRPNGGSEGFPSGHTATAAFGASSLAQTCLKAHPFGQGAVLIAAAFTGTSRVTSGWHDIWQTLAGAVLGWGADRAFRRPGPFRRRLQRLFRRA